MPLFKRQWELFSFHGGTCADVLQWREGSAGNVSAKGTGPSGILLTSGFPPLLLSTEPYWVWLSAQWARSYGSSSDSVNSSHLLYKEKRGPNLGQTPQAVLLWLRNALGAYSAHSHNPDKDSDISHFII